MSHAEIVQAYRSLYRSALRAVQYSKPARYVVRDQLRTAFRETPSPSSPSVSPSSSSFSPSASSSLPSSISPSASPPSSSPPSSSPPSSSPASSSLPSSTPPPPASSSSSPASLSPSPASLSSSPSPFNPEAIRRTIWFLNAAAQSRGLEHRIVRNLVWTAYWRQKENPRKQTSWKTVLSMRAGTKKKMRADDEFEKSFYDHYDWTIQRLNETMGMCLR